ncbi:MAG: META domain-containing protein [Chloroflexi bacterium]|nr:META domain-containing protein [Chloroflexota bacterium]
MREWISSRRWVGVTGVIVVALVLAACASGSSLTGKTWQWNTWTTLTPQTQTDVPDPSSYTVEFKSDGTFQAKADCNNVSGTYITSASQALKITLGPTSLAACGPDSLSEMFVEKLGLATAYTFFRSEMTINLQDLGTMTFK